MSFLDNMGASFGNMTNDPRQMAMLMAAASMMTNSGPSNRPIGLGEIMGGGLSAYLGTKNAMTQQQADEEERKQAQEYRGMQMRGMQQKQESAQQALIRAQALQDHIKKFRGGGPLGGTMPAANMGGEAFAGAASRAGLSGDNGTLNQIVAGVNQGMTPDEAAARVAGGAQSQQPQQAQDSPYQRHMAMAEHMRAGGYEDKAVEYENQALKFAPKVKTWEKVNADGRILLKPYFEDGTHGVPVTADVAEKLEFRSTGGKTLGLNSYTGATVASYKNTATPDAVMVDQRSRDFNANQQEANAIARGEKVATISTGLRKEFEDLPEVKNYKQALPAFSAIQDAVTRNTTQSDINIVYGIAKLYDPTSVVREGEYGTVANSPNIPEKIKGHAQYLAGGGRLSPQVKQELLAEAQGRMKAYEAPFIQARKGFEQIAGRSGADPSLLFPSPHKSPTESTGGGQFSVTAPNGKTYSFKTAKDLANFKLSAGIR